MSLSGLKSLSAWMSLHGPWRGGICKNHHRWFTMSPKSMEIIKSFRPIRIYRNKFRQNISRQRWSSTYTQWFNIFHDTKSIKPASLACHVLYFLWTPDDPLNAVFRSARTSCRTFDVPSRPPVPSTRPVRNNFSWVHRWAVTLPPGLRYPSNCIFYESWWCQLSNSDENTNTKTNTDTNTNTETNKGKTNDSYDVIYCLKGDDKRILNMICYRQGL